MLIKMTNGKITDLVDPNLRDVWERYGFYEIVEEEMTYQEMKSKAKELGINTHGMKKEEIMQALNGGK